MGTVAATRLLLASPNSLELLALSRLVSDIDGVRIEATSHSAKDAIAQMQKLRPDVAVLDAEFADPLCRMRDVRVRVLLLAAPHGVHGFPDDCKIFICGMLDRASSLESIRDAVDRIVHCVKPMYAPSVCETCPLPRLNNRSGGGLPLSKREMQVFLMIGRGMGVAAIARELHLSAKTVETHRENIKRKLRLSGAPELLWAARSWLQGRLVVNEADGFPGKRVSEVANDVPGDPALSTTKTA
jgi:two-component system nitrate/nitrite response regulator NarL